MLVTMSKHFEMNSGENVAEINKQGSETKASIEFQ